MSEPETNSSTSYPYATHLDLDVLFPYRAPRRCVILMVESAGIVPTGD